MNKSLAASLAFATLFASSAAGAAVKLYTATLNGAQAGTSSTKTGTATLSFDDANNKLTGAVTLTGFGAGDINAQHIHTGLCGVSGGVAKNLAVPTAGVITVNLDLSPTEATDLAAKKLYINIHTTAFGNGEVRGQIFPQGGGDVCPNPDAGAGDAGSDGGSSSSSTSSGGSSSGATSSTSSGGSNGATTERADAGEQPAESSDDGGCSATGGSSSSGGLGVFVALGVVLALATRNRNKKR